MSKSAKKKALLAANANHRFNREGWTPGREEGWWFRNVQKSFCYYSPSQMLVRFRGEDHHGVQPEDVLNFIANRVQQDAIAIQKENERRVPVQQGIVSGEKKVAEAS